MWLDKSVSGRTAFILEAGMIVLFSLVPLFFNFPYRINIFLSFEGAYRLYSGQVPYQDFGLPMGYAYWLVPAAFFKLFGPSMYTLVIAQSFLNIVTGFSFRSLMRSLGVPHPQLLLALLIFCLSYLFINFWPWYNNSVFIYQLIGLAFMCYGLLRATGWARAAALIAGGAFTFLSLFTKQDGGGLATVLAGTLLLYHALVFRNWKSLLWFGAGFAGLALLMIVPFLDDGFLYWFNYGQEPHYSRINAMDFLTAIFMESQWIKFYLMAILLFSIFRLREQVALFKNKVWITFTLVTLGILVQALLVQVTSYIPHNVNIYFHSFAAAYLLSMLLKAEWIDRRYAVAAGALLVVFWWSADYWLYAQRVINKIMPQQEETSEKVVSRNTWMTSAEDTVKRDRSAWKLSEYEAFKGVYMPEETIEGIAYLLNLPVVKEKGSDLRILNMSELTPLAAVIGYEPERGKPMWYHKNVAIFQPQIDEYCQEIQEGKYDVVLFEYIPYLNNFNPDEIRECLQENYELKNEFLAPRTIQNTYIELYMPPSGKAPETSSQRMDGSPAELTP
ncbi:hypothetical protein AB9P05_15360 [Roseivirga sp. BDSF3-8]|uniref:hypothetical protein n=1 Tax=Roseivirga sp. BDSF3-8 TaxID=3241598 RepID=UPI003531C2DA